MSRWSRYVSVATVSALGALLVGVDLVLLLLLGRSLTGVGDPHGYVLIFGTIALVFLLSPTLCVVVALVGLLRGRRYGYVWAAVAHACVTVAAAMAVWVNVSSIRGASPGDLVGAMAGPGIVLSAFVAACGAGAVAVAVFGAVRATGT